MGALPRPDVPPGPHRELVDALHGLHHRAGWPSLRVLAREAGCSHTTVSSVFSASRLPSWGVLELLVEAMHGDVDTFRELWLAAGSHEEAGSVPPTIAGRREELTRTRRHLTGRAPGLLVVSGEAGIGKTRLVTTATALSADQVFVAVGSCLPLSSDVPLLPVADVLRSVYECDDGQWLKEALAECAPYTAGSLRRVLPELDLLLRLEPEPDDEWSRQRMFGAIGATLSALGSLRPLAVLVEDLHWADSATLDLMEHLLARRAGVAAVATWRLDDPSTPRSTVAWRERVLRLPTVHELTLDPLSRDETAQQLALLATHEVDRDVVDRIHRRSAGHPLFTEQLAPQADGDRPLPQLLGGVLDRRLEGLGKPAWAIGRALGLADRPLTDTVLGQVTGLEPTELVDALRELRGRRLLREGTGRDVDLRHPLLAEAVRGRLVPGEAVGEHRRIAAALAGTAHPSAAEVAGHWQRAEEPAQELDWRIRAARAAGERCALRQEADEWRRALELWPDDVPSAGLPEIKRAEVYLAALDALTMIDVAGAAALADEAMSKIEDAESTNAAEVYQRAAEFRGLLGDPEGGLVLLGRALGIYQTTAPSRGYVEALMRRELLESCVGRIEGAAATIELATEVSAGLDDPGLERITLSLLAVHDFERGDVELALSRTDAAARLEPAEPDPRGDVFLAGNHMCIVQGAGGSADDVLAVARPGLDAADAWDLDTFPVSVLRGNVAQALLHAGQVSRAATFVDPFTEREPTQDQCPVYDKRAVLDMLRGHAAAASARVEALSEIQVAMLENRIEHTEDLAWVDLWAGRPGAAFDRSIAVIRECAPTDFSECLGALLTLAARAGADRLDQDASPAMRRDLLALVDDLHGRCGNDPFESRPMAPGRPALGLSWSAEKSRLAGRPTLERWAAAAAAWDRLERPHDAAYCRWRGAQVAIATGQGTAAAQLVRRAVRDAREHVPLTAALSETSARAAAPLTRTS